MCSTASSICLQTVKTTTTTDLISRLKLVLIALNEVKETLILLYKKSFLLPDLPQYPYIIKGRVTMREQFEHIIQPFISRLLNDHELLKCLFKKKSN